MKSRALQHHNSKDALRASQEIPRPYPHKIKAVKFLTYLKDFPLRREHLQGNLLAQGCPEKCFSTLNSQGR
jgi:hypothetical protein